MDEEILRELEYLLSLHEAERMAALYSHTMDCILAGQDVDLEKYPRTAAVVDTVTQMLMTHRVSYN